MLIFQLYVRKRIANIVLNLRFEILYQKTLDFSNVEYDIIFHNNNYLI